MTRCPQKSQRRKSLMSYKPRAIKHYDIANGIYQPLKYAGSVDEREIISPSEWVQRSLSLRVKGGVIPFSLKGRDYLKPIYDNGYRRIVLLTGRQVEKSTTIAAKLFGWMTKISNFTAIYAGPDNHTIKTFSGSRLYDFIDSSPIISEHFMKGPNVVRNIETVRMSNNSVCYLKNSARHGANFRGLSPDAFLVDEMQGILEDVVPVGLEGLSHGKLKIEMYCGTPLTMHNFAQKQWKKSTQNEWLIPCPNCHGAMSTPYGMMKRQHYINIGIPNLTPTGLICEKCGARIHAETGQWVAMAPYNRLAGFRIPQPIGEWVSHEQIYYDKVLEYSEAQLKNEVLGISHDSAAVYLTEDEIYDRCLNFLEKLEKKDRSISGRVMVGGIDWGLMNVKDGGSTTLAIFAIDSQHGHMDMVYGRIYPATMSKIAQYNHIVKMLLAFEVNIVCADVGVNGDRNERIAETIGSQRMTQIHYVGGDTYVNYNKVTSIYRIGKTPAMSTFHTDFVTRGKIRLFKKEIFEPEFSDQMMGAGKEMTAQGTLHYIKLDGNDDFLQACIYANMARRLSLHMELVDHLPLAHEMAQENEDPVQRAMSQAKPGW